MFPFLNYPCRRYHDIKPAKSLIHLTTKLFMGLLSAIISLSELFGINEYNLVTLFVSFPLIIATFIVKKVNSLNIELFIDFAKEVLAILNQYNSETRNLPLVYSASQTKVQEILSKTQKSDFLISLR